jgi:hypothetical protein
MPNTVFLVHDVVNTGNACNNIGLIAPKITGSVIADRLRIQWLFYAAGCNERDNRNAGGYFKIF